MTMFRRRRPRGFGWPLLLSAVVLVAAYIARLYLILIAVIAAWLRIASLFAAHLLRTLPQRVASLALDERWRAPEWDTAEDLVIADLVKLAGGRRLVLARARRLIHEQARNPGQRLVALERLTNLGVEARRERTRRVVRQLRTIVTPTGLAVAAGSAALVMLSEHTPGPILDYPWRSAAGVIAAGLTGSMLATAAQRTRG